MDEQRRNYERRKEEKQKQYQTQTIGNGIFNDTVNGTQKSSLSASSSSSPPSKIYLLVSNPSKTNNLGPILRCAAAFGVVEVVAVGYSKCTVDGSHGASKHVNIIAFPTIEQAVRYLRGSDDDGDGCNCTSIMGVLGGFPDPLTTKKALQPGFDVYEDKDRTGHVQIQQPATAASKAIGNNNNNILDDNYNNDNNSLLIGKKSYPIHTRPFKAGNCCFVVGKANKGLPVFLAKCCDKFIHIPHESMYGSENNDEEETAIIPALLDVPSCLSIVLHHYTDWAGYNQQNFKGHKYVKEVAVIPNQNANKEKKEHRATEKRKREQVVDETISGLEGIFGGNGGDY